ncbi:MAG: phosphoenolpyruvate carboxykinase [Acidobacteria bacterium]|nr:phosphoenolpyruvate carboxykinase [Acidobacteriota bacterium]
MQNVGVNPSRYGLSEHGIQQANTVHWNLPAATLYEHAVRRQEGLVADSGPLVVTTGHHTGRSPNDKFIVREASSEDKVWWGKVNRPFDAAKFDALFRHLLAFMRAKDLYVQDCYAGADPAYRIPIRVITETAWHSLFARTLFVRLDPARAAEHKPEFTVLDIPRFHANPTEHGTNSETFIILNFAQRLALIGGTAYAGEIKKAIFTVLNYLLPQRNVLSMHCSANVGPAGDVAIFFGLSGTGKTSLSADPERGLIGDDEHGWSERGVFNFEGGCYAKVIRLSPDAEPQIHSAVHRFGSILENVVLDADTRRMNLDDDALTENTRGAYPLSFIDNAVPEGMGGHPKNIVMLTADAFGVLPPVSKLSPAQAMYHFLSGYTAKVAGTERGVTEPQATFSTCFGAPFMSLHPTVYAEMLGEKIARHKVRCWLINTGWSGGPYGVGKRIKIAYTRAMVHAALNGKLDGLPCETDPVFGLEVPKACPDVPPEVLKPRNTWQDKSAYDAKAAELAQRFAKNFEQFADAAAEIRQAGPRTGVEVRR